MALTKDRSMETSQTYSIYERGATNTQALDSTLFAYKGQTNLIVDELELDPMRAFSGNFLPMLTDPTNMVSTSYSFGATTSLLSFDHNEDECGWIESMDSSYGSVHELRRTESDSWLVSDEECYGILGRERFGLLYQGENSNDGTHGSVSVEGRRKRGKRDTSNMDSDDMPSPKKQCGIARKTKEKYSPTKDPQSIAAKNRRERISERLKILQDLIPNGTKVDLVTMLEKAINYVKFLQLQVKVLATDEFWPAQGGKAPQLSQVKEAIDAILSSNKDHRIN